MKAYLTAAQDWVDLGPDSRSGLRRAARLLRKEVFRAITLDDPVPTAYGSLTAPVDFSVLVNAGLMSRHTEPGDFMDPDGFAVVYTVIDKLSFVDQWGHRWVLGTTEKWEK
jgi:hypothetical protein